MWTHPEHVIDEEPPQQDAAGADVVQMEQLHAVQGKRQAKKVIGYPVLWRHKTQTDYADLNGFADLHMRSKNFIV